jgi:hypothetical protein
VWLKNGDGGRDGDSLCFYVAITLPQISLYEIDGVENLFSTEGKRETSSFWYVLAELLNVVRNQIFEAC